MQNSLGGQNNPGPFPYAGFYRKFPADDSSNSAQIASK